MKKKILKKIITLTDIGTSVYWSAQKGNIRFIELFSLLITKFFSRSSHGSTSEKLRIIAIPYDEGR